MSENVIWMYWHQGFDQANEVVQRCVASWRLHNPGWQLVLLDAKNVQHYLKPLPIPEPAWQLLRVQHKSDLIRTQLLIQYGGVWADPTCFCMKPLDDWLPACLEAGLFLFRKPGRDRVIGNWFIAAARPEHPVLIKLLNALCRYWSSHRFRNLHRPYPQLENSLQRLINRTPFLTLLWLTPLLTRVFRIYPYMIYHYMFYYLVTSDAACRQFWRQMPKRSALEPPILQRVGLLSSLDEGTRHLIDEGNVPLFKLKWNIPYSQAKRGTVLHYLFGTLS